MGKLACVTTPCASIRDLIARCAGEKPGGAEYTLGVGGEPGCAVAVLSCGAGTFALQIGGEAAGVAELVCGALFSLYLNSLSFLLSFSLSCSSRSSYSLLCSLDTLHFSLYLVSCLSYSLHQLLNAHAATRVTNGLNEMIPRSSVTPSGDGAAESDGAGLSGSNADEGEKAQGQEEKQQRGFSVVEKKTLSAMYVRTLLLFAE